MPESISLLVDGKHRSSSRKTPRGELLDMAQKGCSKTDFGELLAAELVEEIVAKSNGDHLHAMELMREEIIKRRRT